MSEAHKSPRYCDVCKGFDVRALLLTAQGASQKPNTNKAGLQASAQKGVIYKAIPEFFKHHANLVTLQDHATSCDLCHAIWRVYTHQRKPEELTRTAIEQGVGKEQVFIGTLDWDTGLSAIPTIAVAQRGPAPNYTQRQLACFEACAKEGAQVDNRHLLARLQASNGADKSCSELARTWLDNCRSNHAACKQNASGNAGFPTRLLAVGVDDPVSGEDEIRVRLVQGPSCSGDYAALSYCWGPDRDLILTERTEKSLRDGYPLSGFPATLKDAITVTRELGIPYIWIDALCIFQDQERQEAKEDWAREAGRMRSVYRGAAITIEAAAATRGRESFLVERQSSKPYCPLPWRSSDNTTTVYLRPLVDITDNQLLGTRIFTRGWTLQERVLAPRTLSFGRQQMSFECANGFVDETGRSSQLPRATELYLSKDSMLQLRRDRSLWACWVRSLSHTLRLPPVVSLISAYNIGWTTQGAIDVPGGYWSTYYGYWRGMIEQFTERQLTNSADRLPALSGLADEFRRTTGDTYLCGHWRGELITSLAWRVNDLYDPKGEYAHYPGIPTSNFVNGPYPDSIKPPDHYAAPSWSWASVQGRVYFWLMSYQLRDRKVKELARVKSVHVTPKHSSDPFGSVCDGYLVLQAPVLHIPDPQQPCDPKYQLERLHQHIQRHYLRRDQEFYQHHLHHEGQRFALLKLLQEKAGDGDEGVILKLLLLESCEDGGYRRLCCVHVQVGTVREFENAFFSPWMRASTEPSDVEYVRELQPELAKAAEMAKEIREAPWKSEMVTIR